MLLLLTSNRPDETELLHLITRTNIASGASTQKEITSQID